MIKNSRPSKILRLLFLRDIPMSAKEISQETGIPPNQIPPSTNRLLRRGVIKKVRKNGRVFLMIGSRKYAKKSLLHSGTLTLVEE